MQTVGVSGTATPAPTEAILSPEKGRPVFHHQKARLGILHKALLLREPRAVHKCAFSVCAAKLNISLQSTHSRHEGAGTPRIECDRHWGGIIFALNSKLTWKA